MLRTVQTVIVDEIHAVIETRRGAHLALTLERLDHVGGQARLQRIGLSATQKPIEDGRAGGWWAVNGGRCGDGRRRAAADRRRGPRRTLDLGARAAGLAARKR